MDNQDATSKVLDTLLVGWHQRDGKIIVEASKDLNDENPEESTDSQNNVLLHELSPIFQETSLQAILVRLLKDIVKPQLSTYKHNKVTNQGTQRLRPREPETTNRDEINPPSETISILYWACLHLDKSTIQANLHLILPPILILLDSSHVPVRTRATYILSNILERIDASILARTGLAEVIWTAIFPNLTSLPPVTDLEESIPLLRITYPTLISLARLWYPDLSKRVLLLDKLVRDGVIYAMLFSSGEKLKVVQVELESLDILIHEMGIYFVKHLKHIIPILSSILADPVGSNHPPQLLQTLQVLETIISVCWPRIQHHHVEILRGVTTCWRYLQNQDSPALDPVRTHLKLVVKTLIATSPEAKIDTQALASIDPYYAQLC